MTNDSSFQNELERVHEILLNPNFCWLASVLVEML